MSGYSLLSAVAANAKNPDTFWVPSDAERRRLRPGDCVKLMFSSDAHPGLDEESRWVERMWVQIDYVDYPQFRGRLNNKPFQPEAFGLELNDAVAFHARHIIQYQMVKAG